MSNERKIGDFVWFFITGDYFNLYKGIIVDISFNKKYSVTRVLPLGDTEEFEDWDLYTEEEGLKILLERLREAFDNYQKRIENAANRLKELENQNGT